MKKINKILFVSVASLFAVTALVGQHKNVKVVSAASLGDDNLWCDGFDIAPLQDGEYTLAVYGDTQKCVEYHPETLKESFQWVINKKDELNVKYVISCGDIVDDVDLELDSNAKPEQQLTDAKDCFDLLKDNDLDFSLLLGNHDYEDMAMNRRELTLFNQYFPLSYYDGVAGYQGSMNDTVENTYHYFNNGDDEYMIVTLGHHPNEEILNWANGVISSHKDKKVILVTHSYIDGGGYGTDRDGKPYYDFYTGGYGGRNEDGDHVWNKVIYNNENIFMVFCGHELTHENHRIGHSVVYGKNGNTIHQCILNPADIDLPYGGAGLVGLFTFRNNGTVDTRFYCPSLNKYMNADSQYSFDLVSKIPEISEPEIVGKSHHEDIVDNYINYSIGSSAFKEKVYSYKDVEISNNGLIPTSDNGSITYKFSANETERIKNLFPTFIYTAKNRNCGVLVSVSKDGENFIPFSSVDGTSTGVMKQAIGTYLAKFNLRDYVAGAKEAYIRLSFLEGSTGNLAISSIEFKQKMATVTFNDAGKFGFDLNFASYPDFEVEAWGKNAIYQDHLTVYNGVLGTGKKNDIAGALGTAIWQFDAPNNGKIDSLTFDARGALNLGNYNFEYCLKLAVSVNGGEFEDVIKEGKSSKTSFSYDLTSKVKNATTVQIKLNIHGAYWNDVYLSSLSLKGKYLYGINYHVGNGVEAQGNPSEYGVSNKPITLKDPQAPEHYEFAGWYDNEDFEGEPIFSIASGTYGSLDLYAKYEPIKHNITYVLNGGKNNSENPKTFNEVEPVILKGATRSGYEFMGWFSNEDFDGDPISEISAGVTSDITLYAKFLKSYRISYVLSGGKINEEDLINSFTTEDNFVLPTPTKEGFTFEGWYLEKDYQTRITNIEPGRSENLIVYAKWSKNSGGSNGCGGSLTAASALISGLALMGVVLLKKKED